MKLACGLSEMNGQGKLVYEDGREYFGQFYQGKKHGRGKFKWKDGKIYDGEWKENKQHGVGVVVLPDGAAKKARFENGVRQCWLD